MRHRPLLAVFVAAFAATVAVLPGAAGAAAAAMPLKTLPIVFEGARYPTLKAAGLDNATGLSFVLDRQAEQEGVVYVFRGREQPQARIARTPEGIGTQSGNAKFWEHPSGTGELLEDWPNTYRPNLTQLGRGCVLWFCNGTWNDVITSIQTNGSWVHAYADTYTGGYVLDVAPFYSIADLNYVGFPGGGSWNDKISSFVVGP